MADGGGLQGFPAGQGSPPEQITSVFKALSQDKVQQRFVEQITSVFEALSQDRAHQRVVELSRTGFNSASWSRLFPGGQGSAALRGADFHEDLQGPFSPTGFTCASWSSRRSSRRSEAADFAMEDELGGPS